MTGPHVRLPGIIEGRIDPSASPAGRATSGRADRRDEVVW